VSIPQRKLKEQKELPKYYFLGTKHFDS
jgi:hypothetical protein